MKKMLHFFYSLLFITSFISHAADFDERPYEVIELINGTKVPKIHEIGIKKLFEDLLCPHPGVSTPQVMLSELLKKCIDHNYKMTRCSEYRANKEYSLNLDDNKDNTCEIINVIFDKTKTSGKLPQDVRKCFNSLSLYQGTPEEILSHLEINYPIKQTQD